MIGQSKERNGKIVYGAIGLGQLKLKLDRACIAQLFERNDQVLDAEEIYVVAKRMAFPYSLIRPSTPCPAAQRYHGLISISMVKICVAETGVRRRP